MYMWIIVDRKPKPKIMNKSLIYLFIMLSMTQVSFSQSFEGYWFSGSNKDIVFLEIKKIKHSTKNPLTQDYFLKILTSTDEKIKILVTRDQDSVSQIKDIYGNILSDSVYVELSGNTLDFTVNGSTQGYTRTTKKIHKKYLRFLRKSKKTPESFFKICD